MKDKRDICYACGSLDDLSYHHLNIPAPSEEVRKATGIKLHKGTCIILCRKCHRIIEAIKEVNRIAALIGPVICDKPDHGNIYQDKTIRGCNECLFELVQHAEARGRHHGINELNDALVNMWNDPATEKELMDKVKPFMKQAADAGAKAENARLRREIDTILESFRLEDDPDDINPFTGKAEPLRSFADIDEIKHRIAALFPAEGRDAEQPNDARSASSDSGVKGG